MDVQASGRAPRFADRVAAMLERVEHRPAIDRAEREAAYRLRYDAYLKQNLLNERLDSMLYDEIYDESPNALTTTTYIDGELASTVRVHVVSGEAAVSPALDVFPDVLAPLLKRRRIMIDPCRLAARAEMAGRYPELAYFALRPPWMAAQHFKADYIVLSCAKGHEEFYRRTCGCETWAGPRNYPKVTAKVVCMGLEFAAKGNNVETRYPSFRSTPAERKALFGDFGLLLESSMAPRGNAAAALDAHQADA